MRERFIERGTDYLLKNAKLSLYETNSSCKDVSFYFDQFVMTVMINGHKTVESQDFKIEFFPGIVFIPKSNTVQKVAIPNASFDNPTKCLVLEINPDFLKNYYEELIISKDYKGVVYRGEIEDNKLHYCSNDLKLIDHFNKLYENQFTDHNTGKDLIDDLIIKQILTRLFQTEALHLLKKNFEYQVENPKIQKSIAHIKNNINQKITVEELAEAAGYGLTSFYNKFKAETGASPVDYILSARIKQAKKLMEQQKLSLKEVAFQCGFNSYEYFCSSFKKLEDCKPSEYLSSKEVA